MMSYDLRERVTAVRDHAVEVQREAEGLLLEIDAALVLKGMREKGQTIDLTKKCIWTVTGRDGSGKLFQTCTIHGEHKVVPE
jgi:hypothetical protein